MSKTSEKVPAYRKHKQSGQAVVTLTDGTGRRKDRLLGNYGTAASRLEYAKVVAAWEAGGRQLAQTKAPADITVNEVLAKFLPWAKQRYGAASAEFTCYKLVMRPLSFLHGDALAKDFGPLALKAVRQLWIDGYLHPKHGEQQTLARNVINKHIHRLRRIFRWAVENELIDESIWRRLQAVEGLRRGQSAARETPGVHAIPRAIVEATLPTLQPMIADMVMLQLETGARPGEIVRIRAIDIDMTGATWLYKPAAHKTAYLGHARAICLGPKAQAIVRRWLVADVQAFLFSPKRCREEQNAARRAARLAQGTPLYPSHVAHMAKKKKKSPKRAPGRCYTVTGYNRAIARAIERHNQGKPENEHLPSWHLHQLRHLRALEVKRAAGLDAARAVLGHRDANISEMYAGVDVEKAKELMARIG
jgi:integrase